MRRHPIIEEAKCELDVAYEEVKRGEQKIMALEQDYNTRIHELELASAEAGSALRDDAAVAALMDEKQRKQERLDIESFYAMQQRAVGRFSAVSSAFAIVGAIDDEAVAAHLLRTVLYPNDPLEDRVAANREFRAFAKALRAFMFKNADPKTEREARDAWDAIEDRLRAHGREL